MHQGPLRQSLVGTSNASELAFSGSHCSLDSPLFRRPPADGTLLRRNRCGVHRGAAPQFVALAHLLNLHDLDAAALRDGRPRMLTQSVATYLHAATQLHGVTFASRLGDDLTLWAIFERAQDHAISPTLDAIEHHPLSPEHPDLQEAFRILGLTWGST